MYSVCNYNKTVNWLCYCSNSEIKTSRICVCKHGKVWFGRPVSLLAHDAGYRQWWNHKHDITWLAV